MKSPRLILLLLSGLLIWGLVQTRERQLERWRRERPPVHDGTRWLAPRFQLADHHRRVVKFERFLGRHRVVLLFFDARLGAENDPNLIQLANCFPELKRAGIQVVAVSDATPYSNQEAEKKRGEPFPFPLLTDIDPKFPATSPAHRMYGLFDQQTQTARNGLFLISRDGTVSVDGSGLPVPVDDIAATLATLCLGEWPESKTVIE